MPLQVERHPRLDLMEARRIYIGGLTSDVKDTDVIGRFQPFGEVASCEVVRGKCLSSDPSACRGFAYVTFIPKDEPALARVFSLVRRAPCLVPGAVPLVCPRLLTS